MHISTRYSWLLGILSVCWLAGCSGPSDVQLAKDVNRYPRTMIIGEWNGRFEYTDPRAVDELKISDRYSDARVVNRLREATRDKHYYRFDKDGTAEFFDPESGRFIKGNWEVTEIEGRTVMIDIRCKGIRFRKPMTFLGYNTITFRPGVNMPEHLKYGRVIYYRVRTWEKKEDKKTA